MTCYCKNCYNKFEAILRARFCSDKCMNLWWREYRRQNKLKIALTNKKQWLKNKDKYNARRRKRYKLEMEEQRARSVTVAPKRKLARPPKPKPKPKPMPKAPTPKPPSKLLPMGIRTV